MSKIIIADNCKQLFEVDETEVKKYHEQFGDVGLLDDRLSMVSYNNTRNMEMYFNYIETCRALSQGKDVGRFSYMLDLGFLPVVMAPYFIGNALHTPIITALDKAKIPYKKLPASSFTKSWYNSNNPDIWVSKMDASKFMGVAPETIKVKTLLEAIL